jgi:5-methylcytosine-specific restriction protein A
LRDHPLCVHCLEGVVLPGELKGLKGRVTPATVVDHIIPHRGDPVLFWDRKGNWQGLCAPHHNKKTGEGG